MAFREVSDLSADTAISLGGFNRKTRKDNPTAIEGYYLGSREVTNKLGTAQLHFFQTAKGNVGVWGKSDLNRKLGQVPVGSMTKASFDRMAPTPTGEMYKYKVAVDNENIIDVEPIGQTTTSQASSDVGFDENESFDDNETSGGFEEEDNSQNVALAKAEQLAKVQALLKKNIGKKVS